MSRCVFDGRARYVTAYVRVGPDGIRTSWWVQALRTGCNFSTDMRGQGNSVRLQSHSHRHEFTWWWGFCCHGYRHSIESLSLVPFWHCCDVIPTTSCCPRVVRTAQGLEQLRRLRFCPRHLRRRRKPRRRARRYRLSPACPTPALELAC